MARLQQRIAYLQGLAAGLAGREESPRATWWQEVVGLLEEMAGELETLREEQEELREFVDALDQSLGELEDDFYETEEEEEEREEEDEGFDAPGWPGCGEGSAEDDQDLL